MKNVTIQDDADFVAAEKKLAELKAREQNIKRQLADLLHDQSDDVSRETQRMLGQTVAERENPEKLRIQLLSIGEAIKMQSAVVNDARRRAAAVVCQSREQDARTRGQATLNALEGLEEELAREMEFYNELKASGAGRDNRPAGWAIGPCIERDFLHGRPLKNPNSPLQAAIRQYRKIWEP